MRRLIVVFMICAYTIAYASPVVGFTPLETGCQRQPSATFGALSLTGFNSKKDVPLKQGVFLVAAPKLIDPNFFHTVILLISHGNDGALGLIINSPTEITIQQVIPDIKQPKNAASNIYFGGPVNRNNLFALFTSDKKPDNAQNAIGKIYFSGSKDVILSLLKNEDKKEKTRIYAGYAGWFPNQLEFEIRRGSWIIVEASEEMIFSDYPENIWPSIFKKPEEIMTWNFK